MYYQIPISRRVAAYKQVRKCVHIIFTRERERKRERERLSEEIWFFIQHNCVVILCRFISVQCLLIMAMATQLKSKSFIKYAKKIVPSSRVRKFIATKKWHWKYYTLTWVIRTIQTLVWWLTVNSETLVLQTNAIRVVVEWSIQDFQFPLK